MENIRSMRHHTRSIIAVKFNAQVHSNFEINRTAYAAGISIAFRAKSRCYRYGSRVQPCPLQGLFRVDEVVLNELDTLQCSTTQGSAGTGHTLRLSSVSKCPQQF